MSTPHEAPVLDARDLSKVYEQGPRRVTALAAVSLELAAGTWLAITGSSGSGKTTLLNLLAGLDLPTSGAVWVAGTQMSTLGADARTDFRRRNIGFVFQFFNLLPTMTAWDNVALPLAAERLSRAEIEHRTAATLEAVGLTGLARHRPCELSGGEQQRVGIARALVMRPRLLLADEPTGNLDRASGDAVLALLRGVIERTGLAIVMVTHSPSAAAAADMALIMEDGRMVASGHRAAVASARTATAS